MHESQKAVNDVFEVPAVDIITEFNIGDASVKN